jgi:O-antigen/teichoic acid export membrane protein
MTVESPVPNELDSRTYGVDVTRIARASGSNLAGAALSTLAGLALTVVVTRGFDLNVAGLYFILNSFFLIGAAAARLGTETGAVYIVAQRRALGENDRIKAAVRAAYAPIVACSVVLAVALWVTAGPITTLVHANGMPGAIGTVRVFALFLPPAVIGTVALSVGRGLGTTKPYVLAERIIRPGLQLLLTLGVAIWVTTRAAGSIGLALAYVVPYAVTLVVALLWARRLRHRAERAAGVSPASPTRADWTQFWRYTSPRAGTGLIQLALQRFDVILMGAMRGQADAARYTAATRLLVIGQVAAQSVSLAVQHRFSALLGRGDIDGANRLYRITTGWLVTLTWPIYLIWAVFAGRITSLFGAGYATAGSVGTVLALSMLVATACGMVSMVLEMAGNTASAFALTALAFAANVAIDVILIPRLGPLGAAIGWSAAILLNNILPLIRLYRAYRLFPIGRSALYGMASAGLSFGVIPGASRMVIGDHWPSDLAAVLVGALCYAGLLWRFRRTLHLAGLAKLRRRGGGSAGADASSSGAADRPPDADGPPDPARRPAGPLDPARPRAAIGVARVPVPQPSAVPSSPAPPVVSRTSVPTHRRSGHRGS